MGRRDPQYHSEYYIKAPYDLKFTVNRKHQIHDHLKEFSIDSPDAVEIINACKRIFDLRTELSKYTKHFMKTSKGSALKRELDNCQHIILRRTEDELNAFCDHLRITSLTKEFASLRPAALRNGISPASLDKRPIGVIVPAGAKMFVTPSISKVFETSRDYKRTHLTIVLETGRIVIPVSISISTKVDIARNGINGGVEARGAIIRRSRVEDIDIITASRHIEAVDRALIEGVDFSYDNSFAPKAKEERPIVLPKTSEKFFEDCAAWLSDAAETNINEITDLLHNAEAGLAKKPRQQLERNANPDESAITRLQKIKEHRMNTPNNPSSDEEFTFDTLATSDQNDQDSKIIITSIEDGVPTIRSIEYTDGPTMTEIVTIEKVGDSCARHAEVARSEINPDDFFSTSEDPFADFIEDDTGSGAFNETPETLNDEATSARKIADTDIFDLFEGFGESDAQEEAVFNLSPPQEEESFAIEAASPLSENDFISLDDVDKDAIDDIFGSSDNTESRTKNDRLISSVKAAMLVSNETWINMAINNIEQEIHDLQDLIKQLRTLETTTRAINHFIKIRE